MAPKIFISYWNCTYFLWGLAKYNIFPIFRCKYSFAFRSRYYLGFRCIQVGLIFRIFYFDCFELIFVAEGQVEKADGFPDCWLKILIQNFLISVLFPPTASRGRGNARTFLLRNHKNLHEKIIFLFLLFFNCAKIREIFIVKQVKHQIFHWDVARVSRRIFTIFHASSQDFRRIIHNLWVVHMRNLLDFTWLDEIYRQSLTINVYFTLIFDTTTEFQQYFSNFVSVIAFMW